MATRTSLDTTVPPPTPSSPRSPQLPSIGSWPVTDVIGSQALYGPEKSSDDAMLAWQRQQTQPAPAAVLSPDRVTSILDDSLNIINNLALYDPPISSAEAIQPQQARPAAASSSPARANTSVADDFDGLLDEALEEFKMSPAAASPSPVPAAAPSLSSAQSDFDHQDIEELLVSLIGLQFADLLIPADSADLARDTINVGQSLNSTIGYINQFFKSLLAQSANPGPWLERESKTPFFCKTHPFGASCFLMTNLDRAAAIRPRLNQGLLAEWKDNYQQCVLLLKRRGLDRYNETEFPFSEQFKPAVSLAQTMGESLQNPQVVESMRQQFSSFIQDPEAVMNQLQAQNPQAAEMLRQQMSAFAQDPQRMVNQLRSQNPQLAELLRTQMGAIGSNSSSMEAIIQPQVQPVISFFKELDLVMQRHGNDTGAVEAWLKAEAAKSTYPHPFFTTSDIFKRVSMLGLTEKDFPASITMLKVFYDGCCRRLTALGLQRYVNEAAPKQSMDKLRKEAVREKDSFQLALSKSLSVLRPLSAELKKLTLVPAALDANRQTIEGWITRCKAAGTYYPPFIVCQDLCQYRPAFEGILDGEQLRELDILMPFCREQLIALGLNAYLQEISLLVGSTAKPAATAAPAPKRVLSNKERFEKELAFFRVMIRQDDKAVDRWLKDNSLESDYPLLWAKKRMSQLSQFRDTVDIDLRRDWRMCAETCLEKVEGPALHSHANLGQIPENASPELKAFITQG